jgi:16S rRNA (cytidine1402-2'-O)-methyltransferase
MMEKQTQTLVSRQTQTHAMKKDAPFQQSSAMKPEIRSSDVSRKLQVPGTLPPGLYVTATPIGNARDITLRAIDVLSSCDAIVAEDTRVTAKLLAILKIEKPLLTYNDHNAARERPRLLARLEAGQRLALVSDAGTPLISDPGFKLVREAQAAGVSVQVVPGASAALAALASSGLPTDKFLFAGFLPSRQGERRNLLESLKAIPATLVFFESPQRLAEALTDMLSVLGPRPAAIARELTKLHEEVKREKLDMLAEHYRRADDPKGEITVVVGPPLEAEPDMAKVDALLEQALAYMPVRAASDLVAVAVGASRRNVYSAALRIKSRADG